MQKKSDFKMTRIMCLALMALCVACQNNADPDAGLDVYVMTATISDNVDGRLVVLDLPAQRLDDKRVLEFLDCLEKVRKGSVLRTEDNLGKLISTDVITFKECGEVFVVVAGSDIYFNLKGKWSLFEDKSLHGLVKKWCDDEVVRLKKTILPPIKTVEWPGIVD